MNLNSHCNYSNPSFIFQGQIGSGTFGTVYKAYDTNACRSVAIKRTLKSGCIVSREFKILQEVKGCKHCVELYDIFYTINNSHELIQHLVFEYMPTSLGRVMRINYSKKRRMRHEEIQCIARQLLKGLSFLHRKSIIHRDIKPDNILLTLDFPYRLKICDFGSAKRVSDPSTPYIVSRFYRAPELIFCSSNYGPEIDVWSAGCLLLELYVGFPVFRGHSDGDQFIQIARVLGAPSKEQVEELARGRFSAAITSKALSVGQKQDLIGLFTDSPSPRLVQDLILGMLCWSPSKRLTVNQCLAHEFFS